jgi:sugar phosphate isomerase/epimerase
MPLFSVSEFTTWHQSFEQDVELYASLGIEGIEVCQRKLSEDFDTAVKQLQLVKDKGLNVTSVQPRCHALFSDSMCPQLRDPVERMARYRETIDLFSKVFPDENLPLVTISGNAPSHNHRHAHATARKLYPELARYAQDHGVRIMFEPLNPILMNTDSFICSLDEAMRLIDDVDHPSFGLMLDVWHIWREPGICHRITELDGKRIFGVHICDWPINEPRHVADRVLPGDGCIKLPEMFRATESSGYRGAYCLEIFSLDEFEDSLWTQAPNEVLQRGRDGFELAWEKRHDA